MLFVNITIARGNLESEIAKLISVTFISKCKHLDLETLNWSLNSFLPSAKYHTLCLKMSCKTECQTALHQFAWWFASSVPTILALKTTSQFFLNNRNALYRIFFSPQTPPYFKFRAKALFVPRSLFLLQVELNL